MDRTSPPPPTPRPWSFRLAARDVAVWAVCTAIAWPAWPGSTLLQSPPFTATEPPANVFMMLDDSASMGAHVLPRPAGISITAPGTAVVMSGEGADAAGNWSMTQWAINRDFDWLLRAPALNPLWYNPAIRYEPWNRDGVRMPNASIGGDVPTTNWGAFTSRADPARLTERDPRLVPSGSGFVSIREQAGRGLIGTDVAAPTTQMIEGRRITLASPAVDVRYYKMPFDFGPGKYGATTAPGNGHASIAWAAHDDVASPLDLFSRPVLATTTTTKSGCFQSLSQCQSSALPQASTTTNTWTRRASCSDATVKAYTSNPGTLTCWQTRCSDSQAWSSPSETKQGTCYKWVDCSGTAQASLTNPGMISCTGGALRLDCNDRWQTVSPTAGSLTCYRSFSCGSGTWGAWGTTDPGTLPKCWSRPRCGGGTDYFEQNGSPGSTTCPWLRENCTGSTDNLGTSPTAPPTLRCWYRDTCSGTGRDAFGTTKPDPLTTLCRYERSNCANTSVQTWVPPQTDPGPLTCYTRQNCGGGQTGPTETVLDPVQCQSSDELQQYTPTLTYRNSTAITRTAVSEDKVPTGGQTYTAEQVTPLVQSKTQSVVTSPPVSTVAALERKDTYAPEHIQTVSCPSGMSNLSCQVSSGGNVPDPLALTPARYYRYTGTGDKGLSTNYVVVQIDRTRPADYRFPVVDAVTGVAPSYADSQRTDCALRTECTWVEEAQNFANWWLYYRNRLFAAQAVVADAMSGLTTSAQQQLRVGYGRINHFAGAVDPWTAASTPLQTLSSVAAVDGFANPGALVRGVRPFVGGSTDRAAFFDWLFSLSWVGATPNREAIDAIGRYFSWSDNRGPWGATPGTNDTTLQLGCRRNFAFLTTDGEWTNVPVGQPLISSTGALDLPGSPTASDSSDGPALTGDGANAAAAFQYKPGDWPQFTTGSASQSGTLTDAAVYYWNRDLRPDLPNVLRPTLGDRPNPAFWQSMSTYIVGYGLSPSIDVATARAAAVSGASIDWPQVDLNDTLTSGGYRVDDSLRAALASRGDFYAARDTTELRRSLQQVFGDIQAQTGSAGGVAVTGAGVTGSSQAFFPSYVPGKWTGSLKAYRSSQLEQLAAGNAATVLWSASVPAPALRTMLTASDRRTGRTFTLAGLSEGQVTALTGTGWTAAEIVEYVRGSDALELPASGPAGGRKFRNRGGERLGDFVNSTPLYVKAPNYGYSAMPDIGSAYTSYVSLRAAQSTSTVYIGGNAGAFHAFDAADGTERFAYVPRGVYADLPRLADPLYSHRYYVDGPVTAGDWHDGEGWRSVVVGTTGAGGAGSPGGGSIFAIDVTNPTAVDAGKVMWDITKGDDAYVGHVTSRGVVGRIRTGQASHRWVYVVGNGYESTSQRAALLVIDLASGELTAIPVGPTWTAANGDAARNGMGGITVAYDGERTLQAVYGGDRLGNLWRFDFSTGVPSGPKGFAGDAAPLFVAREAVSSGTGATRPITAAPRLAPHPQGGRLIVFGTGSMLDQGDWASQAGQGLYAVWEKPDRTTAVTVSDLHAVTVATDGAGTRSFSVAGIDWTSRLGWRLELTGGERIVSDPSSEFASMTVASFRPGSGGDSCNGGGESTLYRIDYASATVVLRAVTGVMGALTPLVSGTTRTRTRSTVSLLDAIRVVPRVVDPPTVAPASQCRLYSTNIQGRPNVIAQNCPAFAPLRVWRTLTGAR